MCVHPCFQSCICVPIPVQCAQLIGMSISNRNVVIIMNQIQCRMARAALQIGVRDLARLAKVSASTVARFEADEKLTERTIDAICAALEEAGVEFIDENGGGAGVRLRKAQRKPK
ncbi:MAG: helix-turn-helix domain-containing protein [Methylocella sp.]